MSEQIIGSAPARPRGPASRGVQLLVVALAGLLLFVVWPVIGAITLAGFVALVSWQQWERLRRRAGRHCELAALLATIVVSVLVVVPFAFTAYLAVRQVVGAVGWLQAQLSHGGMRALIDKLPASLQPAASHYGKSAVALASRGAEYVPTLLGDLGHLLAEAFLAAVTLFYCFMRGPAIVAFVRRVSPLSSAHTAVLIDEIDRVARGLFWGNVMTALLHGLFGYIGYLIARAPAPLLVGLFTMFASFIPGIGTAIIWIPLALFMWLSNAHWNAIFLMSWGFVVIGGLDHLLRPILSRRGTRLPTLLVFLSIYGGIMLFGLKGLLIGPTIAALALASLRIIERERRGALVVVTPVGARPAPPARTRGSAILAWSRRAVARIRDLGARLRHRAHERSA